MWLWWHSDAAVTATVGDLADITKVRMDSSAYNFGSFHGKTNNIELHRSTIQLITLLAYKLKSSQHQRGLKLALSGSGHPYGKKGKKRNTGDRVSFAYAGPTKRPNHHQGAHASTSIATDSRIKKNFHQQISMGARATFEHEAALEPRDCC